MKKLIIISASLAMALVFIPSKTAAHAYIPVPITSNKFLNETARALVIGSGSPHPLMMLFVAPSWVQSNGAFAQTSATTTSQTKSPTNTSTAGDDILLFVGVKTTTRTVTITTNATGAQFLPYTGENSNGTNEFPLIWSCHKCPSITTSNTVTVTVSGGTKFAWTMQEYSNVTAYGQANFGHGTSTGPNSSLTIQDANNYVVCAASTLGTGGTPSSNTGNLRAEDTTGTTSSDVGIGAIDNTASSGSVSCQETITSSAWSVVALELRSNTNSLADHVESSGQNSSGGDDTAQNTFIFPMSGDTTLAGNYATCTLVWPAGTTVSSFVDDKSDTFSSLKSVTGTNMNMAMYGAATTTGARLVTVTLSSTTANVEAECHTWQNTAGTVDATCSTTSETGPALTCGSMTTSAADIVVMAAAGDAAAGGTYNFEGPCREGNGYEMLIGAIEAGYCSEWTVTSGAGSPNPAIYLSEFASGASGDTGNSFDVVGLALKTNSSGTAPSGMYVVRQFMPNSSDRTVYINCPSTGNFASAMLTVEYTSFVVIDSNQVTWTDNNPYVGLAGALAYSVNSTLDSSSMCKMSDAGSATDEEWTRDIVGVASVTPIVVPSACPSPSSLENSGNNIGCYNPTNTVSGSSQTNAPDFTPANVGDMIILAGFYGTGPVLSALQPTGLLFDCGTYTGQSDASGWCYGEAHAHYYVTGTAALNFGYTLGSGASDGGSWGIELKPAAMTSKTCTLALAGAGQC